MTDGNNGNSGFLLAVSEETMQLLRGVVVQSPTGIVDLKADFPIHSTESRLLGPFPSQVDVDTARQKLGSLTQQWWEALPPEERGERR